MFPNLLEFTYAILIMCQNGIQIFAGIAWHCVPKMSGEMLVRSLVEHVQTVGMPKKLQHVGAQYRRRTMQRLLLYWFPIRRLEKVE